MEILDPAVGTGTFITELIEHFRGQPQKLRYKYLEELHANEVAILPYYVANLNIEATYAAINGLRGISEPLLRRHARQHCGAQDAEGPAGRFVRRRERGERRAHQASEQEED